MAARRRFLLDINKVGSFCKKFELLTEQALTLSMLEVKSQELERRYEKLCESYDVYCVEEEDEQKKEQEASRDTKFEDISDAYQSVKAKIKDFIIQKTSPQDEPQLDITLSQRQNASIRLPTVNVPIFEGGYSKWPAFRDLFKGIFESLTPGQKLAHLHDRTKGEPNEIVSRFDLVDSNFALAWKALENRYENPRILVHHQMKKLFGIPCIQSESAKSLRQIQSGINDSLAIFKSYKINVANWDPFIIHLCSSKIPEETLKAWEDFLPNHKELPTWAQMDSFLSSRIEKLETVQDFKRSVPRDHNHNLKSQAFHTQGQEDEPEFCPKCNQSHLLWKCKQFQALSILERIQFARSKGCCLNCLSAKHFRPKCVSSRLCKRCNKNHHTLLHMDQKENKTSRWHKTTNAQETVNSNNSAPTSTASTSRQQMESVTAHFSQTESATVLPTALVNLDHLGTSFTIRALLDGGSEKSFISARIQQRLSLLVEPHQSQISGLGGTVVTKSKGKCNVILNSRHSNFSICIKAIVVPKLSHLLPSRQVNIANLDKIREIPLADPYFYKPAPIDMIIGSDFLPYINCEGFQTFEGCLEARASHFGWYISGPEPSNQINAFSTSVSVETNLALHEQLKMFWDIEEVKMPKSQSDADIYCEQLYRSTTYRGNDGKYVVRLPFKEEFPNEIFLGPSKYMALAQYSRMEKTLEKTPALKDEYNFVLQEYENLLHMEEVKREEEKAEKVSEFYLPHHAVVRPESKSTKVRVVFNASKKTKSGFSLNDALYTGPILQANIIQIIINWRFYEFVFTGDIQKMYRQIWVHEEDRPYQQILFRRNENESIKSFQLKTVTFGINCAPFLAIRTLQELSKDVQSTNPQAAFILQHEVYVDDILSGGHSLEDAKLKQIELKKVLASGGFPTKKVTANHKSILEHLPREDLLSEDFLTIDDCSITKTLGIRWNALSDSFSYAVQPINLSATVTKRQMLSVIAKLFDPLGWIGPVIITAKIFMQELWELKSEWDDEVPPHLYSRWKTFITNLPRLSEIKIPRWIHFSTNSSVQLHGFCDASEKAYCGTVYLRIIARNGEVKSSLIVAKTRVTPIKRTTIPKLELCGAVLLTKLISAVSKNVQIQHETYLWTDSAIVLGWLQRNPQSLKTFVANRVGEILNEVSVSQWKHVKTDENPADIGSRGCIPQELKENHLWWHGPTWLQLPQKQWPKPRSFEPTDLETKDNVFFTEVSTEDIISRFSSLDKCLRTLSYIFRFYNSLRGNQTKTKNFIDATEMHFVRKRLISITQQTFFSREIEGLKSKINISRKSSILTLNPFLDEDQLLRVGGRISNSELSYDAKHPIIIPGKSYLAELIVKFTHIILLHSEFHIMLRAIRQGYYIPQLKNLVRKCIRECKICTVYKHKFQQQIMSSLPEERVTFSLPFTYTGVDFAGPFNLKTSNLRNAKIVKGYAAVFVCFSTKAVHLETCSDLSTEAFLATFARFTGRRGLPKTMFSDNGRNFLGASLKLLKDHNKFLQSTEKMLSEKYSIHGFKWSFIPPYSPHMGGLWEAAVKSMKTHLKKVSSNVNYTFEEFTTVLVRVEAILNSRPLSPMTQSPQELLPLTPGHFLRGAPIISTPEGSSHPPVKSLSYMNRWERLKAVQNIFAQRWKTEYITELQRRYKWKTTKNNAKENDFVIIKEDFLPPTEWKLGRITKITMTLCRFCLFNHPEKYCPAFRTLRPEQRRKELIRINVCLNCLAHDHTRDVCTSLERCIHCAAKHHSMIHRPRPTDVLNTSFEEMTPQTKIHPIIQGIVVHHRKQALVNLLVDKKVKCSFIHKRLLKKLLDGQMADLRIPSIRLALSLPSAPWITFEGVFEVKDYYDFPESQAIHDPKLSQHLSSLTPIANPCFSEDQVVDGIIGCNFLPEITLQNYPAPKLDPLEVVPTKFGWLISGRWSGCYEDHVSKNPMIYKIDTTSGGGGC